MASRNYSSIRTEYYCSPHYILHSIYQIQNEKKLKVTLEFKMLEQNLLNLFFIFFLTFEPWPRCISKKSQIYVD